MTKSPLESLIAHFDRHLAYFEKRVPFARPQQFQKHRQTISLRQQLGSASAALKSDTFLDSVAETIEAWGVGSHNAVLVKSEEFRLQIRKHKDEIAALDCTLIDKADEATGDRIWRIIRLLNIVLGRQTLEATQSKLVGGSKALHHILPDLMPPIDRMYTAPFLLRTQPQHFQKQEQEAETFRLAFESFRAIAKATNPAQYVGRHPWHTSRTKVIDNAIVGSVRRVFDKIKSE